MSPPAPGCPRPSLTSERAAAPSLSPLSSSVVARFVSASPPASAPHARPLLTRAWLGAEAHGQRTTALLGKAYTTISPDAATGLTGLADVRMELVSGAGWTEEQGMLVAPSAGSGASQPAQGQGTAGMQQLQQLTEYIVRLDT